MLNDMRRLYPRGAANRGLCVDAEGAMLGAEWVLVQRTLEGFRALQRDDAAALQKSVLSETKDSDWLLRQCGRIADALNRGEIALAQIYGLHIPLGEFDERQLQHIAPARLTKTGFNPDEPRLPKGDPHGGEWTTRDDAGGGPASPEISTADTPAAADAAGDDTGGGDDTLPTPASGVAPSSDAARTGDQAATDIGSGGAGSPPIQWEIKPLDSSATGSPPPISPSDVPQPGQGSQVIPTIAALAESEPEWPAPLTPTVSDALLTPSAVGNEAEWVSALTPTIEDALKQTLLRMGGASLVLGFLFIPTNRSPVTEGSIANVPGASFRFDGDMGILQLRQNIGSLGPVVVNEGHVGTDGIFRDAQGRVIGRYLSGSGVVIDAGALPGYRMLPASATAPDAGTRSDDRPRLCPDPSAENTAGRSDRSLAYQEQITGLPRGLEVKLNDVRFDGCREEDGTMLEAKGPGFADKMTGPNDWRDWFTGDEKIEYQMQRQFSAAIGRKVEWHFAEKSVADFFRAYAEVNGLTNIIVIYTPPRQP